MFRKTYLTHYKMDVVQPKNCGCWHFTLSMVNVWFWGLFTTKVNRGYQMAYSQNFKSTIDRWDKLIRTSEYIKWCGK